MNTITVNRAVMRKHIETLSSLFNEVAGEEPIATEVTEVIKWMESLMGRAEDDEPTYALLTLGDDWQVQVWGPFNLEDAKSCHAQQDPEIYCKSVVRHMTMPDKNEYDPNLRR